MNQNKPFFKIVEFGQWKRSIKDRETKKRKTITGTYKHVIDSTGKLCGVFTNYRSAKKAIPILRKKLSRVLKAS